MAVKNAFVESYELKKKIVDEQCFAIIEQMGDCISSAIINGKKLMLCGNGGSASDAQHLAAELLVRLRPTYNRQGLPALSLAQDTSTMTACGNDFGYDYLYERVLRALGNKGDVLLGITTSGKSKNVLNAFHAAAEMGITTMGFLGGDGGEAADFCDYSFVVPSKSTGRIQEAHITAGHALMEYVEDDLLNQKHIQIAPQFERERESIYEP